MMFLKLSSAAFVGKLHSDPGFWTPVFGAGVCTTADACGRVLEARRKQIVRRLEWTRRSSRNKRVLRLPPSSRGERRADPSSSGSDVAAGSIRGPWGLLVRASCFAPDCRWSASGIRASIDQGEYFE